MFRRRWLGIVASATAGMAGCTVRNETSGESPGTTPSRDRPTKPRRDETLAGRVGLRDLDAPDWDVSAPETDGNTVTLSATDDSDERITASVTVYEDRSTARGRYQQRRHRISTGDEDVRDFETVDLGDEGFQYRRFDYEASAVFRVGTAVSVVDHDAQIGGSVSEARAFAERVEGSLRGSGAVPGG